MGCLTDYFTSLYHFCFNYHCRYCKTIYSKKWYNVDKQQCFFCYHFHSVYHTKAYMLKKVKTHYEEHYQQNKLSYYEEYLDLLRNWCDHYGIETTSESIEVEQLIEEEILSLKYPTTRSLFLEK
jgi:hypothetical protein